MTEMNIPSFTPKPSRLWIRIAQTYIAASLPFLIALVSIRLVMSPLFLQIEYPRPDFPEDDFGFTTQDRLNYAPYALNYLLNGSDISYLGDLQFPDGTAMFNARELQHMRDVKVVTQTAYLAGFIGIILAGVSAFYLWRAARPALPTAIIRGGVFTIGIIAAIVLVAVINWDFFFTGFHTLFFASGTWRFEYSDTLIRLFPEQFWFDASLTIGGLTTLTAIILLTASWLWGRNS